MRRHVLASAILATCLLVPLSLAATPTAAAAPTDSERATSAVEYLWYLQAADGSLDHSIGETADFIIGTAAAGYDPATLTTCPSTASGGVSATSALDYLATASDAASDDAGKTGKAVLAIVAAGGDPASFHGRNLIARLTALYHSGTGAYGDGSTFGQSLAMIALKAAGQAVPAEAIAELKGLQGPDGSWGYDSTAPAARAGDTNSTAIALMALEAAGDDSADAAGLAYLATQQQANGGFIYAALYGGPADVDSDALVLQALVATGQDPEGPAWLQGSNSVLTHIRASQGTDGGFAYPGMAESALTTSQIPAALMRVPYGAPVHWTAGHAPGQICIDTSITGTPPATHSPTPRPTVKPTPKPTAKPAAKPTPTPTMEWVSFEPTETATPSAEGTAGEAGRTPAAQATNQASARTTTPDGSEIVAGETAIGGADSGDAGSPGQDGGSGSNAALYALAALFGAAGVLVVGWVFVVRPGRR